MSGFVYILSSSTGTLYTGSTDNLPRRVLEHRAGHHSRFASKYGCHRLVWWEEQKTAALAMQRERKIKGWTRAKKLALIELHNPEWRDLALHWEHPVLSEAKNPEDFSS